jgi:Tfp pilus assembly protein PilF
MFLANEPKMKTCFTQKGQTVMPTLSRLPETLSLLAILPALILLSGCGTQPDGARDQTTPGSAAAGYVSLGDEAVREKDLWKAVDMYTRAISEGKKAPSEAAPALVDAFAARGTIYSQLGKYELAIPDFDKALEIDPARAYIFNNRGVAYKAQKKYAEALKDFTAAQNLGLRVNPKLLKETREAIGEK